MNWPPIARHRTVQRPEVDILITGKPCVGKTTLCEKLIGRLEKKGFLCGGVICPDVKKDGMTLGKEAVNVRTKASRMLAVVQSGSGGARVVAYVLNEQAVDLTKSIIDSGGGSDVFILDDIGPVALEGTGIEEAAQEAFSTRNNIILIVRSSLMNAFTRRFMDRGFSVFEVTEKNRDELVEQIIGYIEKSLQKTKEASPILFTH
jgi:nucleoside-triphosphatase